MHAVIKYIRKTKEKCTKTRFMFYETMSFLKMNLCTDLYTGYKACLLSARIEWVVCSPSYSLTNGAKLIYLRQ